MSISAILGNANSALNVSAAALRITSSNVANANTPGYARVQLSPRSEVLGGVGAGVGIGSISRAADRFLQATSLATGGQVGASRASYEVVNRAQAAFGDPSGSASLFARFDPMFANFGTAALDPSNLAARRAALTDLSALLARVSDTSAQIQTLRAQADADISGQLDRANTLLAEIAQLNGEISRARIETGDSTGAEGRQSVLIDELAGLIDIKVQGRALGGVDVRLTDGFLLVGDGAAQLQYTPTPQSGPMTAYGEIRATMPGSQVVVALQDRIRGGSVAGLIQARDVELTAMADQLGELSAQLSFAMNAAHNQGAAYPPPATLRGRETGLLTGDALGFSGRSTIAVTDAGGVMTRRIDVDFTAGTLSVNGGAPVAFTGTVGGFTAALNTALGTFGTASFGADGRLTLNASGGAGLVLQDSETNPARRGGMGFSHFFGLNDLVTSGRPTHFATGLAATDAHGFAAGQTIRFRIAGPDGAIIGERTVTLAAGTIDGPGDPNSLISQLNDPATGIGGLATATFDAQGRLQITPNGGGRLEVMEDTTQRGTTGLSLTQLFGVGSGAGAARASGLAVRADVLAQPARLALAMGQFTLNGAPAAVGQRVLAPGDGRAGTLLAQAGEMALDIPAAGGLPASRATLADYAARVVGDVGRRAQASASDLETAQTLKSEADQRRASVEGVNIDEELVKLTVFQQSYNAAARLIRVADELYETLLSFV